MSSRAGRAFQRKYLKRVARSFKVREIRKNSRGETGGPWESAEYRAGKLIGKHDGRERTCFIGPSREKSREGFPNGGFVGNTEGIRGSPRLIGKILKKEE